MSRQSDDFLQLVRAAEDPTQADEERVLASLQAAIAAGAKPRAQLEADRSRWLNLKLAALLGCGAAALATLALLTSRDADSPAPPVYVAPEPSKQQPLPPERPAPELQQTPAKKVPLRARRAAPPTSAEAGVPQGPERSLRSELDMLQRVQVALRRGDGAAALRELDAHASPEGSLLAEREAARVLALCLVGEISEARRLAAVFAERHPDSPQRAAIDSSCANSRRIEPP